MDKEKTIELLRKDMMGEHQAIIQYLSHAYAMGEGEIACEVEAIAREEMRHLDWLADAIVELGGDPSMDRDPVDWSSGAPHEQLGKDVDLEQVAIDQYRNHIEQIDDPKIRRLLGRILHDELVHKDEFHDLSEEAKEELGETAGPGDGKVPERLQEILNQGVRHEYTVILQYLFHSFMTEDKEAAEELENTAINEMQHMGWLAEELAERGAEPDYEHDAPVLTDDLANGLEADIAVEQQVTDAYSSQIPELDDDALRALLSRIRDHEIYHEAVFKDLLAEARESLSETDDKESDSSDDGQGEGGAPQMPSIGSLLGQD